MGTIIRKIIRVVTGAAIALLGLVIAGYSTYEIIQGNKLWQDWLLFAFLGIGIAGSGLMLIAYGFRSFIKAIVSLFVYSAP